MTPKVASTDNDGEAMANVCFWLGAAEAAEFHGLNVSVCHPRGRGREVSTLKPEDLSVIHLDEDLHSCNAISTTLQHDKDDPSQELTLCPHRHSLQEDPHFGFICSPLAGGCNTAALFPNFNREASVVNKDEKTQSRVEAFWTLCFNNPQKQFKSLSETASNKLTCQHGRKGTNQKPVEIVSADWDRSFAPDGNCVESTCCSTVSSKSFIPSMWLTCREGSHSIDKNHINETTHAMRNEAADKVTNTD